MFAVGSDLAISKAKKAAGFVSLVGAIDPDGHKHLVSMFNQQSVPFHRQADEIVKAWIDFDCRDLKVESNGYQDALIQEIEQREFYPGTDQPLPGTPPVSAYTTNAVSKRDMDLGIPGLASEVMRGEWTIWDADGLLKNLMEQAKLYPNGDLDDCILAWLFLRAALRRYEIGARGSTAPRTTAPSSFRRRFASRYPVASRFNRRVAV